MDHDFGAGWRKGSPVVIEGAMDLGPCRQARIDSRTAHEVEGQDGLGQKSIPEVQGKIRVCAAKGGDKMILEGPDGTFICIATMQVGRGKLEFDVLIRHILLESLGGFVV